MGHNEKNVQRRRRMLGTAVVVAALAVGAAGCNPSSAKNAGKAGIAVGAGAAGCKTQC